MVDKETFGNIKELLKLMGIDIDQIDEIINSEDKKNAIVEEQMQLYTERSKDVMLAIQKVFDDNHFSPQTSYFVLRRLLNIYEEAEGKFKEAYDSTFEKYS